MPAADARARLGVPPDRTLVYVSAGGGGDPDSESALLAIVQALGDEPDLHLLVGAGPLYQGTRMGGPKLTWFTEPEIAPYMAACDGAIAAGGYNTFHELLHLGIPSVLFAQDKVADDQALRIREAAAVGACLWLETPNDPDTLRSALRQALAERETLRENAQARVPDNGAARAARALLARSYPQEQLSWAESVLTPKLAVAFEAHGDDGCKLMASWLPKMVPALHVDSLQNHPSFRALVSQLSAEAANEVRRSLGSTGGDNRDSQAVEVRLVALLNASRPLPGGIGALCTLIDNAMKKHPPSLDPDLPWFVWLDRLLGAVADLVETQWEHFDEASVSQIYRTFPRIADAGVEKAFEAFAAMMKQSAAQEMDAPALLQRLRALKFANKRITVATMAPLTGWATP
jgi:hypothetical protein